jgi:hypothetical protein
LIDVKQPDIICICKFSSEENMGKFINLVAAVLICGLCSSQKSMGSEPEQHGTSVGLRQCDTFVDTGESIIILRANGVTGRIKIPEAEPTRLKTKQRSDTETHSAPPDNDDSEDK